MLHARLVVLVALSAVAAGAFSDDPPAKAWDPATGTAEIHGRVTFSGDPPERKPIDFQGETKCAGLHAEPLLDESVQVAPDGGLRNVFVRVKVGLEGWRFPGPVQAADLSQKGCMYVPRVLGLRVGQPLQIRNEDPLSHNVHILSREQPEFNVGQAPRGGDQIFTCLVPEDGIRIKCDVHAWMGAFLFVVDHPYFAVTGADGVFRLPGLPPGEYVVEAWHEKYGTRTLTVQVGEKESAAADFVFTAK